MFTPYDAKTVPKVFSCQVVCYFGREYFSMTYCVPYWHFDTIFDREIEINFQDISYR